MKGIKGWYNVHGVVYATQDAELRYTTKGTAVMNVRIALTETMKVDDKFEDQVVYLDTVTWGKKAEAIAPLIKKGTAIMIHEAKLIMDEWDDKNSGDKRQKVKLKMIRLAPLVDSGNSGQQEQYQAPPSEVSDTEPF